MPRPGELVAKFGLTEQHRLKQCAAADLEVGQHAQLFERRDRQILRLVDDQQDAPAGPRLLAELLLDPVEQLRLGDALAGEAEALADEAKHVVAFNLGRDDADRVQPLAVDRRHQVGDQCGLARADVAGDGDEPFALGQAVAEIGHRLLVGAALIPEARIRSELKGTVGKPVIVGVHPCLRDRQKL